ncbi:MAG: cellulase family glycosylhydrolase [Planctomycetota bacterium]
MKHTMIGWLLIAALTLLVSLTARAEPEGMSYWSQQRYGANFFNRQPTEARFRAAHEAGIEFVRLVPDKWESAGEDFLIGNAERYEGIPTEDLTTLREALDHAHANGVRVVLTMLSLPGSKRRGASGAFDPRLWSDKSYWDQAAAFWRDLAEALDGHPAIAAYSFLNEPHPARALEGLTPDAPGFAAWFETVGGTSGDLNAFNRFMLTELRTVDTETPVILEGYGHAGHDGLTLLEPADDPNTLYAFHFYDPWRYTTFRVNKGRFAYPQVMPGGWGSSETLEWQRDRIRETLAIVDQWATEHGLPSNRVIAAEFGVSRRVEGAAEYLTDVRAAIEGYGWHAAFYAFREDVWEGMDYELGASVAPEYWTALEAGAVDPGEGLRRPNPLWDAVRPRRHD